MELVSLTSINIIDLDLHVVNIPKAKCEVGENPNNLQHCQTLINLSLLGYFISSTYVQRRVPSNFQISEIRKSCVYLDTKQNDSVLWQLIYNSTLYRSLRFDSMWERYLYMINRWTKHGNTLKCFFLAHTSIAHIT